MIWSFLPISEYKSAELFQVGFFEGEEWLTSKSRIRAVELQYCIPVHNNVSMLEEITDI